MPSKLSHTLNAVIVWILKATVFATPLFFVPVTFEYFEFNKQMLLWAAAGTGLILWLVRTVVFEKKIVYKRTPLDVPIAAVLVVWGIATALSVDRYASLFGTYGRFADAYLGVASLAVLYFLVVQSIARPQVSALLRWFVSGAGLAVGAGLAALFGVMRALPERWSVVHAAGFSPVGATPEVLALYAACLVTLVAALASYRLADTSKSRAQRAWYSTVGGLSLAVLVVVNSTVAWIALAIGMVALFGFGLYVGYAYPTSPPVDSRLGPSLGVLLVTVIMLFAFGGAGSIGPYRLPREALVPRETAHSVAKTSLRERPLFGFGPGAYHYAFSAARPAAFNAHPLWQIRFDKSSSYWLELVSTVGIFGILAYAGLVGMALFITFVFVRNIFRAANEDSYAAFGFSFLMLTAIAEQALYPSATSLLFLFWFGLAIAMVNWRFAFASVFVTHELDLRGRREALPVAQALTIALIAIVAAGGIAAARAYAADMSYNRFQQTGDGAALERAATVNPERLQYHTARAREYMHNIADDVAVLSTPGGANGVSEERREEVRKTVDRAVRAGEAATEAAPHAVSAWETLAALYRDIRFIAVGSTDPALRYFKKAQSLEPTNPVFATEIGKLHLDRNETGEAVAAFQRALELKPDYLDARRGLAKAYDELGQTDKALVILEEATRVHKNPELLYEAGRLYYNQGKLDEAIARFTAALELRPGYANAMYSLGLAYQQQGKTAAALEQFRAVLQMNPGNEAVQNIIAELES